MELFSLKNKTAIVTGAGGLLGKYHCLALAEAGANVIAADLDLKVTQSLAKEVGDNVFPIELDVTSKSSIEDLRDFAIDVFGSIDILVNNAAINDMFEDPKAAFEESKFENYSLQNWQSSVDVNLTGVFLCCQIIGFTMTEQGSGSIINIASTYGVVAPDQSLYRNEDGNQIFYKPPAYSVTKAGVIAMTKYLASYWGKSNIRVNTLSPGGVENNQDSYFIKKYSQRAPLARMAQPNEYKGALIFLAGDSSSYMTGANLIVDGGWTAW